MNTAAKQRIMATVLAALCLGAATHGALVVHARGPFCDGRCYAIEEFFDFSPGSYPRMARANDLLLVAYSTGAFMLDGINLTTREKLGTRTVIPHGIDAARATLHVAPALDMILCVYNHHGAASVGIAWAPRVNVLNVSAWQRQDALLGPVQQAFFHVGLWEPFLAPYNDTAFLLYQSNQTLHDPDNPIDASNYSFLLDGYQVVQKIDIHLVQWNGTGFTARHIGAASATIPGGPVHFKDGMASSVLTWENQTHKDYIMTFEQFKPPYYHMTVAMVKIRVSSTGVETLWRRDITTPSSGAPFITRTTSGTFVTSFRFHHPDGTNRIGFVAMNQDQFRHSQPIYMAPGVFGWPSVLADDHGGTWLACEVAGTGVVRVMRVNLSFTWT